MASRRSGWPVTVAVQAKLSACANAQALCTPWASCHNSPRQPPPRPCSRPPRRAEEVIGFAGSTRTGRTTDVGSELDLPQVRRRRGRGGLSKGRGRG